MSDVDVQSILSDLVEIPSVTSDRAANDRLLEYVAVFLGNQGMHVERREHDGYGALVATTTPTRKPRLMLVAHADVQPAAAELFHVREADGKLFGRGVLDMKSALAAYMALARELAPDTGRYDYGIAVVTNEEIGGLGVKNLLDEGFVPEAAVLLDGGKDWILEKVAKGAWTVRVTVQGRSAHGSRPWDGDSASFKLLDLLDEVRSLFKDQNEQTNTLNISQLTAGEAQNMLPALAQATLDIRVTGQAAYRKIKQQIADICRRYGVEPEVMAFFAPIEHGMSSPYVTRFADSVESITGVRSEPMVSPGSSDAVYYTQRGIPCVVTRPPGGGAHADDEWIDKAAFLQLTPLLKHYVTSVCKRTDA